MVIVKLAEKRFDKKDKKADGLMNNELDGKIITEFTALRAKSYSCLIDDGDEKAKGKKSVIKQKLKFEDYKNCL